MDGEDTEAVAAGVFAADEEDVARADAVAVAAGGDGLLPPFVSLGPHALDSDRLTATTARYIPSFMVRRTLVGRRTPSNARPRARTGLTFAPRRSWGYLEVVFGRRTRPRPSG